MRGWVALLSLMLWCVAPGLAAAGDMAASLRLRDWAAAEQLAGREADPLAHTLVQYLRLLSDGGGTAAELAAFLAAAPGWPREADLVRRYSEALAGERDDGVARALCAKRIPTTAAGLLRCGGLVAGGEAMVRRAWLIGVRDLAMEASVLRRWAGVMDPALQRERFLALAWSESAAPGGTLARQAARLAPGDRAMGEARLALRRDDPAAAGLVAALPEGDRSDPGMVLDLLRWERRAQRWTDAAQGWVERGAAAESAAPVERQPAFWSERQGLVRELMAQKLVEPAYAVALVPSALAAEAAEADVLRGWVALRGLGRAEAAAGHLRAACAAAHGAGGIARAQYWLGRALAAAGDEAGAATAYAAAAAWPTTYHGQLAALAAGGSPAALTARLRALDDPVWEEAAALEVTGSPFGRAAALLVAWGERRAAKGFVLALASAGEPGGAARLALLARYAAGLGLPDASVALSRRAEAEGLVLPGLGWPEPIEPTEGVERAAVLGVIRQESSFDPAAGSPAGAQGLMQLMPRTAAEVARGMGVAAGPLTDAALNVRLGTAYLAGLLRRFVALPPALAAYNAGPTRARQWLSTFGDPATGGADPVDWVELIPFAETRNYVQLVVANVVVYRAKADVALPHPVLGWGRDGI